MVDVERLVFEDKSIGLDVDREQIGGQAVIALGALVGPDSIKDPAFVGFVIVLLDDGMSFDELAAAAIDALLVIVGSDFSRTPYYNSGDGKDHWPIGSYIIMEKGARYTNRLVDGTDELQNALAIDPKTLKPSTFGTKILTSHVHDALRDYLGLANASTTAIFPFNNPEKFNFFV